jgi:hypothetical protein
MSNLFEEIQAKAATLSIEERAVLALRLIESLEAKESTSSDAWHSAWLAECKERLERYESGEDRGVSLEVALQRAQSQLK